MDVHSLVGGAAEVLGAEAGQQFSGDGTQQRFDLHVQPHFHKSFVLERVDVGLHVHCPLQFKDRNSLRAGLL